MLPSTFDPEEFTEEKVYTLLTSGIEVLRMVRAGDPNSDDETARDIYRKFFAGTGTSTD